MKIPAGMAVAGLLLQSGPALMTGHGRRSALAAITGIVMMTWMPAGSFAQVMGGICKPVSERTGEVGCRIIAHQPLGELTQSQPFWHLDTYPDRTVAEAAKGPHGTVVEALGKIWLLTIEAPDWHASGAEHVADIGPLPITPGERYSAQYMEAIFEPGMTAPEHHHPGPEAWYTAAGETCLETSEGKKYVGRAGGPPVIVPGGPAMHLTATGTAQRRALVLILHETAKPAATPAPEWKPKGLCKG